MSYEVFTVEKIQCVIKCGNGQQRRARKIKILEEPLRYTCCDTSECMYFMVLSSEQLGKSCRHKITANSLMCPTQTCKQKGAIKGPFL